MCSSRRNLEKELMKDGKSLVSKVLVAAFQCHLRVSARIILEKVKNKTPKSEILNFDHQTHESTFIHEHNQKSLFLCMNNVSRMLKHRSIFYRRYVIHAREKYYIFTYVFSFFSQRAISCCSTAKVNGTKINNGTGFLQKYFPNFLFGRKTTPIFVIYHVNTCKSGGSFKFSEENTVKNTYFKYVVKKK